MSAQALVNWNTAAATAKRLVKVGPRVSMDEATEAVRELTRAARRADHYVSEVTGIAQPSYQTPTIVVDRPTWIDINAASFGELLEPIVAKLAQKSNPGPIARTIGSRATGAEAGILLSFMASRVLGQYDAFGADQGKLLLVAPNIIDAERKLNVDPSDFRLWVCIHEVTHRLQFTANPWLADHLRGLLTQFVDVSGFDGEEFRDRLRDVAAELTELRKSRRDSDGAARGDRLRAVLLRTPEQRALMDQMTALMSLLEGHAEYVMDAVGPEVVPSVASIRAKFARRRKGRSPIDRFFRRLLGLEAKMRQYRDGRIFVEGVIKEVGMAGFNEVWTSPETLPTLAELKAPATWVNRVRPTGRIQPAVDITHDDGATTRTFTVPRSRDHVPLEDLADGDTEIIVERRGEL